MRIEDGIKGMLCGVVFGGLAGLGVCVWLLPEELSLFPGDTIVAGGVIFGALGYLFGDRFFDFLREHWHWFT